jgi:hypothetical protein
VTGAYAVFASLVVAALAWIHFTGWSPRTVTEAKSTPTSVRDNPGSSRSTYGGARPFTGAK